MPGSQPRYIRRRVSRPLERNHPAWTANARLKITLDDVEPVVVREVSLAIRLDRLHLVIHAAIP